MTPEKLEMYRNKLLQLDSRIGRELADLTEGLSNGPHAAGEHDRFISDAQEADIVVGQVDESIHSEILSALQRVNDGTFGVCVDCGKRIIQARLDVLPYAPVCVACETIRENA